MLYFNSTNGLEQYSDITLILYEIERRFRKKSIFISGSAEEYTPFSNLQAQKFVHLLAKSIIQKGYVIINGFGWGIGSAVINGALEAIYKNPKKYSENQLVLKPFPQFETGSKKLPELWEEYRYNMISQSGVSIIIFGNKKDNDGNIINADGVYREFEIANEKGVIPIPIFYTGYMANEIFEKIKEDPLKYYNSNETFEKIEKLKIDFDDIETSVKLIMDIINCLN